MMKNFSTLIFTCLLMNMASPQVEAAEAILDVAVIGGGLSGLSVALNLKETTQNFRIFEAQDRLGGRAWTKEINGKPVDVGGEFIDKDHKEMHRLIKHYKLKTNKARLQDEVLFISNGEKKTLSQMQPCLNSLFRKLKEASKNIKNDDYIEQRNGQWVLTALFDAEDLEFSQEESKLLAALIADEEGIDAQEAPLSSLNGLKDLIKDYQTIVQVKKHINFLLRFYKD